MDPFEQVIKQLSNHVILKEYEEFNDKYVDKRLLRDKEKSEREVYFDLFKKFLEAKYEVNGVEKKNWEPNFVADYNKWRNSQNVDETNDYMKFLDDKRLKSASSVRKSPSADSGKSRTISAAASSKINGSKSSGSSKSNKALQKLECKKDYRCNSFSKLFFPKYFSKNCEVQEYLGIGRNWFLQKKTRTKKRFCKKLDS